MEKCRRFRIVVFKHRVLKFNQVSVSHIVTFLDFFTSYQNV